MDPLSRVVAGEVFKLTRASCVHRAATAKRSRCKGARNARELCDLPLSARPASAVANSLSFTSQGNLGCAGANKRSQFSQMLGPSMLSWPSPPPKPEAPAIQWRALEFATDRSVEALVHFRWLFALRDGPSECDGVAKI